MKFETLHHRQQYPSSYLLKQNHFFLIDTMKILLLSIEL